MSPSSKGSAVGVVLLVTIIEDSGLIVWLVLLRASILVMGFPVAALVLLLVLLAEHSIMQSALNPKFTGKIFLEILGFTLLEVVNWAIWLALLSVNDIIASAYFFVGFYAEHQITENVLTQQPYLQFRNARATITAGVILETLSEGVGARLWILFGLTGIVLLLIGSVIEHSIQYVVGRLPVQQSREDAPEPSPPLVSPNEEGPTPSEMR